MTDNSFGARGKRLLHRASPLIWPTLLALTTRPDPSTIHTHVVLFTSGAIGV